MFNISFSLILISSQLGYLCSKCITIWLEYNRKRSKLPLHNRFVQRVIVFRRLCTVMYLFAVFIRVAFLIRFDKYKLILIIFLCIILVVRRRTYLTFIHLLCQSRELLGLLQSIYKMFTSFTLVLYLILVSQCVRRLSHCQLCIR